METTSTARATWTSSAWIDHTMDYTAELADGRFVTITRRRARLGSRGQRGYAVQWTHFYVHPADGGPALVSGTFAGQDAYLDVRSAKSLALTVAA